MRAQDTHRFIEGISFGDAAQVEAHSGDEKLRGAVFRIEMKLLIAYGGTGFFQLVVVRHSVLPPGLAPQTDKWPHGDVKCSCALPGQLLGPAQYLPQLRTDFDCFSLASRSREGGQFTVGFVIAEDIIELFDPEKGRLGGFLGFRLLGRI